MAFNWPGKKETREPGAKPEFPSAFDTDLPEATIVKGENPLRSAARETAPRVAAGNADVLALLTQRLETLGQMLDETKELFTSYLLHRESQTSGDDVSKDLARKVEALAERLEQSSGSRGLDQKLDALYGKIDQMPAAIPRGGSPASSSGGEGGGAASAMRRSSRPYARWPKSSNSSKAS